MESEYDSKALVPATQRPLTGVAGHAGIMVPRVIAAAGDQAARRFLEFFAATIRNKNRAVEIGADAIGVEVLLINLQA